MSEIDAYLIRLAPNESTTLTIPNPMAFTGACSFTGALTLSGAITYGGAVVFNDNVTFNSDIDLGAAANVILEEAVTYQKGFEVTGGDDSNDFGIAITGTTVTGLSITGVASTAALAISGATGGKITSTVTAETASDPGRQVYLQRTHTGTLGSGKGLTGIEVRSTFNGAAAAASSEVKGGEFKARHTGSNTYNVGTFKGVIGNCDSKSGAKTITSAWAVEGQIDCGTGSTITTAAGVRVAYNEDGTVTNAYGVFVDGTSVWNVGVKITDSKTVTGIDVGTCTTGIQITGVTTDGLKISGDSANAINITSGCTPTGASVLLAGAGAIGVDVTGVQTTMALRAIGQTAEVAQFVSTMTLSAAHRNTVSITAISPADAAYELRGLYVNTYPSTAAQATSKMRGILAEINTKFRLDDLTAIRGYVNCDTAETIDNTSSALHGDVNVDENITISAGHLAAVHAQVRGDSTLTGSLYGIAVDLDMSVTTGLDFDVATDKTCATGIELGATGTGKYTDGILISGPCDDNGIEITGYCTGSAIDIAQTLASTTGQNIINLNVTDSVALASGYSRALFINWASTGAQAGGYVNPFSIDFAATTEVCSNVALESHYITQTGNKLTGNVAVWQVYMEDVGNAASSVFPIDIGRVMTNKGSSRDCFMRAKGHGGNGGCVFYIEGTSNAMVDNLFTFCGCASKPFYAAAVGGNQTHKIKVSYESTPGGSSTDYYIPLYTA